MKANVIKNFFRSYGIPVRVRTVACKQPFAQVWIEREGGEKIGNPLVYKHEFPLIVRQTLLKIVYGDDCTFAEGGNAGNVRPESLSFNANEWNQLIARINA